MKRRFQVTLLAVAIASLSASAFAMAPVISDFPSPIIADDTPATGSNDFVYPDVFDLNTKATDPDNTVAPSGIIWSFTGDGTYSINNRQPLNLGTDDPNAPGTKEVGKTGQDDSESVDSNPRTITFRNSSLSPDGGSRTDPGGGPGLKPAYTKPVTLFASDGSTYSMTTFLVYTDKSGEDRISGGAIMTSVLAPSTPATTGTFPWTSADALGGIGSESFSASGGLCINSPLAGANFGTWISPYGILPLLANQVYRIRISISSSTAIAANATPAWDFVVDNFGSATQGESKYSSDFIFWDNNGSANSAVSPIRRDVTYSICGSRRCRSRRPTGTTRTRASSELPMMRTMMDGFSSALLTSTTAPLMARTTPEHCV
jgi:hypothetical protein